MKRSHLRDLALSLVVATPVLWYLLNQPLSLDWHISYSSTATGSGAIALSSDDSAWRPRHRKEFSISPEASQSTAKAHIQPLPELPARARIELNLPASAKFLVYYISFHISHPLLDGAYSIETVDVLEIEGAHLQRLSGSVAIERDGREAWIEVSLAGLQKQLQWKTTGLIQCLLSVGILYGFLRALRCRPLEKCVKLGIYGFFFAVFIYQSLYYVGHIPFGKAPDELAHVSYIAHLQESDRWYPDFETMPIYFLSGELSGKISHLGHAPTYYLLFTPFSADHAKAVMAQWRNFRFLNLGLAISALAILFWIGMRLRLPLSFHFIYLLILVSIPMLPYLAAGVNNDNLALFSGALLLMGALLALEKTPAAGWLLGLGICLAPLAKATAGLQAGIFIFLLLLVLWRGGVSIRELLARFGLPLAAGATLPLLYYGYTLAHYGTPLPIFGKMDYERQPGLQPMDFTEYLAHFINFLHLSWTGIVSHQEGLPKVTWPLNGTLTLVPLFAVWGLLIPTKEFDPQVRRLFIVAKLGTIALLGFAVIHFAKVYSSHLQTAYLGGVQARYYFPFVACLVIGALIPFYRWRTSPWTTFIGAMAVVNLLYSNVFIQIAAQR